MPDHNPRYDSAKRTLAAVHQEHVLTFYDALDQSGQDQLLGQIERIDWPEVARLIESHVKNKPNLALPKKVEPATWYPHKPVGPGLPGHPTGHHPDLKEKYTQARQRGEELIRHGKVAAFTVAGGQGTRLGWEGSKGTFPATPIRGLPLFAVFAEYLIHIQRRYETTVPWYLMTSETNDAETRAYFKDNDYFGLGEHNIQIFVQGMMPAIDLRTTKVLLAERDSLALSPNGHGGSLKALRTSGALDDMKQLGVEQISYFQVDNPLVRCVDPLFIGLHDLDGAQMSSKMLPKAFPKEKLGNFCLVDGKMIVIEYSDLPDELAYETLADGSLRFRAGSIAIHILRRDFVESLTDGDFRLPFHRAEKKVAYIDLKTGETVKPEQPNAVKLETFVFDALPMCDTSIILETDRVEEFAPIKNAASLPGGGGKPATDSPQTSKDLQVERAARWLESRGVNIPRDNDGKVDAVIEISQATAIYPDELKPETLPSTLDAGAELLL